MTKSQMIYKMKYFNSKFFDNVLSIDDIDIKVSNKLTRALGYFRTKKIYNSIFQTIKISSSVLADEKLLDEVIVHELIHAWQFKMNYPLGHGRSFKLKMMKIREIDSSMNIVIRHTNLNAYSEVQEKIKEKRLKRLKNQYAIIKNNRILFMKNVSISNILFLKGHGYDVFKIKEPMLGIRNCQNIHKLFNAKYFYTTNSFDKIDWERV